MYKNIIVTGSVAYDHIMEFPAKFSDYIMPDKIGSLNVSFNANRMRKENGGTAGNVAYSLALLGLNPKLVSSVGSDFSDYENHLVEAGVDCSYVKHFPDHICASGFCLTDKQSNQIWSFALNAMNRIEELEIPLLENSFVIISPSGPIGVKHFVKLCKKLNLPYLYDPAFAIPELSKEDLIDGIKNAKIVIGNAYEIELMKRKTGLSLDEILEGGRILITTMGENGSKIEILEESGLEINQRLPEASSQMNVKAIDIPIAKPKLMVDPTGAGDAYRAGFLAGFLHDFPLELCGQMGSITSVFAIENYGTTKHLYTLEDFQNRLAQEFNNSDIYDLVSKINTSSRSSKDKNKSKDYTKKSVYIKHDNSSISQKGSNSSTTKNSNSHKKTTTQFEENSENERHKSKQNHKNTELSKKKDHSSVNKHVRPKDAKKQESDSRDADEEKMNDRREVTNNKSQTDGSGDDFSEFQPNLSSERKKRKRSGELNKFVKTFVRQIQGRSTSDIADD